MWERYPPTPPAFARYELAGEDCRAVALANAGLCSSCTATAGRPFHCGENEIQVSFISSTSVGATPTPATNFREVIRQSGRNPDVSKHVGSDDWSITSTSHHFRTRSSISRAPRCLREG